MAGKLKLDHRSTSLSQWILLQRLVVQILANETRNSDMGTFVPFVYLFPFLSRLHQYYTIKNIYCNLAV